MSISYDMMYGYAEILEKYAVKYDLVIKYGEDHCCILDEDFLWQIPIESKEDGNFRCIKLDIYKGNLVLSDAIWKPTDIPGIHISRSKINNARDHQNKLQSETKSFFLNKGVEFTMHDQCCILRFPKDNVEFIFKRQNFFSEDGHGHGDDGVILYMKKWDLEIDRVRYLRIDNDDDADVDVLNARV
jgi:hypothetical protein